MFTPKKDHKTDKTSRQERYRKSNGRLREILARLYEGEVLSMKELAEEFWVSLRTIQRDVNERLAAFPLRKDGEKFSLDDPRVRSDLDPEDMAVLELLDEFVKRQGRDFYAKAHRVLKKLSLRAANPYCAKLNMEEIGPKLDEAALIERAIKERRRIRCRYRMDDKAPTIDIEPIKIANFEGFWYVIARDARNGRVKKYRLRNISRIERTAHRFEVSEALQKRVADAVNVWSEPANDPIEIRLFVDAKAARYFRVLPIAPTQEIVGEDRDGSMEISVTITHPMEIVPIVKYWLPHLRVMKPDEAGIDAMVRRDIEAYTDPKN